MCSNGVPTPKPPKLPDQAALAVLILGVVDVARPRNAMKARWKGEDVSREIQIDRKSQMNDGDTEKEGKKREISRCLPQRVGYPSP